MTECQLLDKTLFAHRARKMSRIRQRIDNTLAGVEQSRDAAFDLGKKELDQTLGLVAPALKIAIAALLQAETHLWTAERISQ